MSVGGDRVRLVLRRKVTIVVVLAGLLLLGIGSKLTAAKDTFWRTTSLGTGSSLLAAALVAFLAIEGEAAVPQELEMARNLRALGLHDAFLDRSTLGNAFWSDLLSHTKNRYRVLGVASHRYHGTAQQKQTFGQYFYDAVTRRTVTVEILFLDPNSVLAEEREREEGRGTRADIVESIEWFWKVKQSLGDDVRDKMTLKIYDDTPTCGITWADDNVIVAQYLARELNLEAPGFKLVASVNAYLAEKFTTNYTEVSENGRTITQGDVDQLIAKRQEWRTAGGQSESEIRP